MKALLTFLLLGCWLTLSAQEFTTYPNGLIYSPQAMKHINYVVDSLNLKFKKCEFNRKLITDLRGKGTYIHLSIPDSIVLLQQLESDLYHNMSLADVQRKYAEYILSVQKQINLSFAYTSNLDGSYRYKVTVERKSDEYDFTSQSDIAPLHSNSHWYFKIRQDQQWRNFYIDANWIEEVYSPMFMPEKYAYLVNYADCMIDTTATIFEKSKLFSDSKEDQTEYEEAYIKAKTIICPTEKDFEQCIDHIRNDQRLLSKLDKRLKNDTTFLRSLRQAVIHSPFDEEYGSIELPDSNLNWLVERYAPLMMLDYVRQGAVVGECSHDDSPRLQAQKIAYLSAEAHNWGIFLRSHLNIMNDRFVRWGADGKPNTWLTYIQELEATGINVLDLIFGISLYVANPSPNHYFGNIGRLGRALAESKDSLEFERRAVNMITDADLDSLNRIRIAYLYTNYLLSLREEGRALPKWEGFLKIPNVPPAFLKSEGENIRKRLQNKED